MCAVMKHYEDIAEARGEARGRSEGIMETLTTLVKDGVLTAAEAASRAGISVQEFTAGMQKTIG